MEAQLQPISRLECGRLGSRALMSPQSPSEGGNTILVSARLNNGLSYNLALSTETARTLADKVNDALENPAKISQQ